MTENEISYLTERVMGGQKLPNVAVAEPVGDDFLFLYPMLSAFANCRGGGVLLFGLSRGENGFLHCDVPEDLEEQIAKQARQMDPQVFWTCSRGGCQGKVVAAVEIAECTGPNGPCYYRGEGPAGSYLYEDGQIRRMDAAEFHEISGLRSGMEDDRRPVLGCELWHLNHEKLEFASAGLKKRQKSLAGLSEDRLREILGVMREGEITLAGLLLFGSYPQEFYPGLMIKVKGEGSKEAKEAGGSISEMADEAYGMVVRPMEARLRGLYHASLIRESIRELIIYILLNRDYSIYREGQPIILWSGEDSLWAELPGRLPGELSGAVPMRNRLMTALAERIGLIQEPLEWETLKERLSSYGGCELTQTCRRGITRIGLLIPDEEQKALAEEAVLAYCQVPRSREELTAHFGGMGESYTIRKYIQPLLSQGKLVLTIPEKPRSKFQRYQTK